MNKSKLNPIHVSKAEPVRFCIDIGSGKNPKAGFVGIDAIDFGQKYVHDVRKGLPFEANTVDEVNSSHFVEHLTGTERVAFFNDLYRVMKVGAVATIVTPNWSHACAYGDPTHQWPPMSSWYALYLDKSWRDSQAPHGAYTCDFVGSVAGKWDARLNGRDYEFTQVAMNNETNAWRDLVCTLTKR